MNKNIRRIVEQIHPFRRMINSEGLDNAFISIKNYLPDLKIHEFFPGETADDWEVPYSWELKRAYLKNSKGEVIVSDYDSHLFVAAYSEPVNGIFYKEEIAKHLRCHPLMKDAFFMEHRHAYNYSLVDWGITLPQRIWNEIYEDEPYEILIEVDRNFKRSMKVGEVFIKGESDKIICFTAHIDELCNDNLSSCAVLIEFFKQLKGTTQSIMHYSYQLLLIPEVIGTFFYLKNNPEIVKNTVSMINLETVGRGEKWLIKKSLKEDNYIDKLMVLSGNQILKHYQMTDIFGGYGNDERVYEYPTIKIPSVALQRYPFDEYHSSADLPDKLSDEYLNTALDFVKYLVEIIEKDFIPEYVMLLPPWLTKHGLYFDSKDQPELFEKFMNHIQFNINGRNSLVELCYNFNIPFEELYNYIMQFVDKNFINPGKTDVIWKN